MQRTPLAKTLSITLLLSCVSVSAMNRSGSRKPQTAAPRAETVAAILKAKGPASQEASPSTVINSNHTTSSPEPEASPMPEKGVLQDEAIVSSAVATRTEDAKETPNIPAAMSAPKQAIQTLLGKEIEDLYSVNEAPLLSTQFGGLKYIDPALVHPCQDGILAALKNKDASKLGGQQPKADLTRVMSHLCAGFIRKLHEQSSLDKDSKKPTFTVENIETIINTQYPRFVVFKEILGLLKQRQESQEQPKLYPDEDTLAMTQKCFAALSQLQLERQRIRNQEANDQIRLIKDAQRLTHAMRLADKEATSDGEYSDLCIFEKTTK